MNKFYDKADNKSEGNLATGNEDKGISKKTMLMIIVVAVILLAIIWIWKEIELNKQRNEANNKMQMLQEKTVGQLANNHTQHLKLLAKPYVWAIRNELLRGNINQVNVYANEMVKEKNFQSIVVANDKGVIISSTNKKNEGKQFATVGKPNYISSDTTIVENINDTVLVMSSPIMGFNNRLGTLMVTYKVERPDFK
ncbi:MAG: hypothetical protein WKF91_04185 [Segetibacter sp.]